MASPIEVGPDGVSRQQFTICPPPEQTPKWCFEELDQLGTRPDWDVSHERHPYNVIVEAPVDDQNKSDRVLKAIQDCFPAGWKVTHPDI